LTWRVPSPSPMGYTWAKYSPLDFKSCFSLVQWFLKIRVSELVVGSGEPDKCLEEKKIAKVFILSLMSTHDFWNVHIHTQQSKLLQNKQWKKENIYQLRQSKFDHKFKNPKISGNFSFFVGNFYVHNSNAILISPKNCMIQNSALKIIWSLSFLKLFSFFIWNGPHKNICSQTNQKFWEGRSVYF